eukprot:TRINITY_DN8745_c0_g1_i5.p1 TRINITY_DN8745_c0_g1~~TRINITY_DN8745_c0_g1_i5.p1  ORF type:complete len:106 (-),score=36.84 TRINITY_DN8745_c0_g1_i5:95-412(-)
MSYCDRFFFLMIRRPPRSTQSRSSAASDVYKRQGINAEYIKAFSLEAEELVDFIIKNKHYPLNYLLQLFHQNISISMLKKKITSEYLERIQLEYLSYLKMVVDDK